MPAVAADDVAQRDRAVVAALRLPAGVAPEQDLEHRARLDHHQDRRHEGREQDLDHRRGDEPDRAAGAPPALGVQEHQHEPEELRRQEHRHGDAEQRQRALGIEPRPLREERELAAEIFRPDVGRLQHEGDADDELEEPERRGEIRHDAGREVLPRRELQAARADDPAVLQVALAPAPVARRDVDERGRALLVAAREVVQHVDRVAGAPHQRRLDEIVAEHVAAERRPAGKVGQPATGREGARADNGVVAPIVAVPARPHREARPRPPGHRPWRRTAARAQTACCG